MDIQQILAALGSGGGATRPLMLNPGTAMGALSGGVSVPGQGALQPGAMPQMPHPMLPGPQAPNQSAQMAMQALSAPQQQAPSIPMPDAGMLALSRMNGGGGGGPFGDLLGLNKSSMSLPINNGPTPTPMVNSAGGLQSPALNPGTMNINTSLNDLGGQSAGIHGLFHRLAGLWGG